MLDAENAERIEYAIGMLRARQEDDMAALTHRMDWDRDMLRREIDRLHKLVIALLLSFQVSVLGVYLSTLSESEQDTVLLTVGMVLGLVAGLVTLALMSIALVALIRKGWRRVVRRNGNLR